jgi:hypothetical protein
MSRLTDLEDVRRGIVERMESCQSDQNFAVLGRLLVDVVKQIEELSPAAEGRETGLSDFEKRLREREAGAKGSRSAGRA